MGGPSIMPLFSMVFCKEEMMRLVSAAMDLWYIGSKEPFLSFICSLTCIVSDSHFYCEDPQFHVFWTELRAGRVIDWGFMIGLVVIHER